MNYFSEIQTFKWILPWLLGLDLFLVIIFGFADYRHFVLEVPFSTNNSANDLIIAQACTGVIFLIISLLMIFAKLETRITKEGISYRYFPFIFKWRFVRFDELEYCEVVKFSPIGEFGGWGYKRKWGGKGWCATTKGNFGLRLSYNTGKRFLIGTQKKEELKEAIIKAKERFDRI